MNPPVVLIAHVNPPWLTLLESLQNGDFDTGNVAPFKACKAWSLDAE